MVPFDGAQRGFIDGCGVPVFDPAASLEYELYHYGVGYGTVRRHTRTSLADAEDEGLFGGEETMLRFRSSSNAEDDLRFNGAGLYDSTGACLADELDDDRYLVTAQAGELDVVSSEPGVWPEQALLTLDEGRVSYLDYTLLSSELPEGEHVLHPGQLTDIGAILYELQGIYPLDDPPPEEGTVLLDTEWKVTSAGQLVIKQIRPFLKTKP